MRQDDHSAAGKQGWRRMLATSLSTRIAAFFLATLLVALVNVLTVQALLRELNGVAETVNVAGRLRMLSQQMAYLGTRALHEPAPANRLALGRSIADYDTALAALASGGSAFGYALRSPGTAMAGHLRALRQEWNATAALRRALLSVPAGGDMAVIGAQIAAAQSTLLERAERLMLDLTEEARQAQREAMSRIYTLVAIDVLLLALAFTRARRKLVAPLRALATQSRALAAGDYRVRAATGQQDEIGELAQAFNFSAERIGTLVADLEADRQQLEYGANYDALTGLANRTLLSNRLRMACADAAREGKLVGVLLHDLDNFKIINDSLGHEAGDTLLRAVALRMRTAVREADTVARLGGDEFLTVVPDIAHADEAMAIAAKLVAELERPFTILHQQVYVSASIGLCLYPRDGESEQTLLRNVDLAMYRAKREGRNTVRFFTEELNHHNRERQKMEVAMHHALETGGFELHYQPKVDYASGAVTGVEALVRWHHPEMGLIEPAAFIPLAEETGLIERLGAWVLHTACADNHAWQAAGGTPMVVAVNLSARQLNPAKLVRTVAQALAASGLAPRYLELELTETAIMHDAATAIGILEELKALGVRLSLDDFGTGYSSLGYLRRFPFDSIKIDRSFIVGIGAGIGTSAGDNDRAIVKTIIALASNLRMNVIAEGVEQHEQAAFLLQHGCHDMQGFLFARALPAAQLNALLAMGACPPGWRAGLTAPLKPEVSQA